MGADDSRRSENRNLILATVTAAHTVSHFLSQGFLVALPTIRAAMGISPVGIGAIMTVREVTGGVASLPAGVLCDRLRHRWGAVLAICMVGYAAGWLLVGSAPTYSALMVGMVVVSISGSISHLPSMAALSHCFSRRRGTALAVHGVGGTLGDVLGPSITGVILTWMTWRGVISIYAAVPLLLGAMLYWAFRGLRPGREGAGGEGLRGQLKETRTLLKSPTVWLLNLVSAMRGMCFQAYTTFLPLFLAEEIGFGSKGVGLHLGLLFSVGMVASPVMGYLSDRVGRKAVVVPTLVGLAVMSVVLALYGEGVMLTVIIAALGFFIRSDYPLISAMVLDAVGENVATTTLGVMSFTRFSLSAVSPLIAGYLYQRGGMDSVLFYAAGLYAVAAIVLLLAPLRTVGTTVDPG